jgi:hypothetical protein
LSCAATAATVAVTITSWGTTTNNKDIDIA